jgi:hypothetical protein
MTSLKTCLQEQPNDRLWRALGNVRQAAEEIWDAPLHRYYTDHKVTHSERVIEKLDGLTAGIMARAGHRLSPSEIYVLLAAAYLHDIGMQDERYAGGDLETIRAEHHERTAAMIVGSVRDRAHYRPLGLDPDPTLVELIALVAKAHRKMDLSDADYAPIVHGTDTIRPRLLGALLRFADELDIDHRRVILGNLSILLPDVQTFFHWYKCYYVSGLAIQDEYIKIYYRFPQDEYTTVIPPLVENEIRNKLYHVEDILREGGIRASIARSEVRVLLMVDPMPPIAFDYARQELCSALRAEVDEMIRKIEVVERVAPQARPFYLPEGEIDQARDQVARLSARSMRDLTVQEVEDVTARVYDVFSATLVGFVNRQDEIRFLTQTAAFSGLDRVLVTAPAGFGKSYLLRAVEEFLRAPDTSEWLVAKCDLSPGSTVDGVVQTLSDQIQRGGDSSPSAIDRLSATLERACLQAEPKKIGGVLLLDRAESLSREEAVALQGVLHAASQRLWQQRLKLRVILATRYTRQKWEDWGCYRFPLSSFTTPVIEEAIQRIRQRQGLSPLDPHTCYVLASEIRWVSGGYPESIVHILDELSRQDFRVSVDQRVRRGWFREHIRPLISHLLCGVPEELHAPFRTLSVFRWLTAEVINSILASGEIRGFERGDVLLQRLTAADLIRLRRMGAPGYKDELVRAVLQAELYFENPLRFRTLCELAWGIHDRWLRDCDASGSPLKQSRGLIEQLYSLQEAILYAVFLEQDAEAVMRQLEEHLGLLRVRFGSELQDGAAQLHAELQSDEELRWAARQVDLNLLDQLLDTVQSVGQMGEEEA